MSDWQSVPLNEVCNISIGGTPSRNIEEYWGEEFPWVAISDLHGRVITETSEKITLEGVNNSNVKVVREGTVIMSFKLSIGRVAYAGVELYTNEAIASFDLDDKLIDNDYFYYQLPEVAKSAITDSAIKGATLNKEKLNALKISFPDLDSQQKIAKILSTVDKLIEKTQTLIDKYTAIKQGMMADLFTRGIDMTTGPNCGKLRPSVEDAPELYKQTELGCVPREWEVLPLSSVLDSVCDGPFGSNLKTEHYVETAGVRVVRLQNITKYKYNDSNKAFISLEHSKFLARNKVLSGDVLIAGLGDENYPVGRACCYPEKVEPAVNKADCFRARCNGKLMINYFLMLFLNSDIARGQVRRYEQGVTRPRINTGNFKRMAICCPSLIEQQLFIDKVLANQNVLELENDALRKLHLQKKGLMQDLLTGKVKVQ